VGETFGAAMRGGAVASHVKIGEDVHSPLVPENKADVILGLEPLEAFRVGVKYVKPGGMVITNIRQYESIDIKTGQAKYPSLSDITNSFQSLSARIITLDATELALQAGTDRAMNIVMLGVLSANQKDLIPLEIWEEVIRKRVPPKFIEVNVKAFELGYHFSNEY
jgi:indolepyruvate ferredoxin oxidoreductase beta subunit